MNYLKIKNNILKKDINKAINKVIDSGQYILGNELSCFENEFAEYCSTKYCLGVGNGTDALTLALIAVGVGPGDYVACTANTGFFSTAAILSIGAFPKYVDIENKNMTLDPDKLEGVIDNKTKCVIVTHIYGKMAKMPEILDITKNKKIAVVEDCAQSHGAVLKNRKAGSWGDVGSFSFYPTKNLGALGDGGALTTNSSKIYNSIYRLRQYGWNRKFYANIKYGRNSRLDEIQAAILRVKLKWLNEWNTQRREIAKKYILSFKNTNLQIPKSSRKDFVAHHFPIRTEKKKEIMKALDHNSIIYGEHYPIPDYAQEVLKKEFSNFSLKNTEHSCKRIITLPCNPELKNSDLENITKTIINQL